MAVKFCADNLVTIYQGDSRSMNELPDECVQVCVTSPPYWGLRKYAGEQELVWGGTEICPHEWLDKVTEKEYHQTNATGRGSPTTTIHKAASQSGLCLLCGAVKCAFGLEPTPELYVQHTVEILREIRRVLRSDGVCLLNIGDSYASGGYGNPSSHSTLEGGKSVGALQSIIHKAPAGLKPKDLCLIPFRVALAAQADGWWCRSVIIWSKNNPMPESCKDRPTESHEYILMLTKAADYYWDQEAVREPHSRDWGEEQWAKNGKRALRGNGHSRYGLDGHGFRTGMIQNPAGRNLRSVWTFSTQSFSGAHFATFPEELVKRCVLAATPEVGCCAKCGAPWERVIEKYKTLHDGQTEAKGNEQHNYKRLALVRQHLREHGMEVSPAPQTVGWKPACQCGTDEKAPALVLDCFAGSGTTLAVAKRLGRRGIGYDLSEEYCKLAIKRVERETAPFQEAL